jgi:bifunctional DNase/RNase
MPTATDRDFLDMRVSDVRRIAHAGQDHHVVLLQETGSGRRLPIWIGHEHARLPFASSATARSSPGRSAPT